MALISLSSCRLTPTGHYFLQGTIFNAANQVVSREIDNSLYGQSGTHNSYPDMPRLVSKGDVNGDGNIDWAYYDGNGNRYWAIRIYDNEEGLKNSGRKYFKQGFGYWDYQGDFKEVPKGILIMQH